MNRILQLIRILICIVSPVVYAQEDTTPIKGLHRERPTVHALVNATVVTEPGKQIEGATITLRDGWIEGVGKNVKIPEDARIWDLQGKTIYAGFIDAYSQYGMPEGLSTFQSTIGGSEGPPKKMPQTPSTQGASNWNPVVTPERDAFDVFKPQKKSAENLSDNGFTVTATYPGRGVFRGQGMLTHTHGKSVKEASIKTQAAQHITFDLWGQSQTERPNDSFIYPTSLMGSIALVRQTLYDARWYQDAQKAYQKNPNEAEKPAENSALDALRNLTSQKQWALFTADNEVFYRKIESTANEFDLDYAILGNGYEYRRIDALKEIGKTIIIPLAFPQTPHVEHPDKSLGVSFEQLQHWELAPSNAAFLEKAEIPFCFTSQFNSDSGNEYWRAMRLAVKRGLSEKAALAAITTVPAKLYAIEDQLGTIQTGNIANLTIATGNLFSDDMARVSEVWIQGSRIEKEPARKIDLNGTWTFTWSKDLGFASAQVIGSDDKLSLKTGDTTAPIALSHQEIIFALPLSAIHNGEKDTLVRLQARILGDRLVGNAALPSGEHLTWSAERTEGTEDYLKKEESDKEEEEIPDLVFDRYPAGAYGVRDTAPIKSLLITNATLWTSGPRGTLKSTDLLIVDGKIKAIGENLKVPRNTEVINVNGKHVTPGLIDCHSHVGGTGGLNEYGHSSTVEVRVGDVLNPADINIFRQLAGGLTAANILHGSANPMGGQSQVIKMRWGQDADGLKLKTAKPSVKFALGENVKRSRDPSSTRYPNSRLGVEQFFVSNFRAAEDYERTWSNFRSGKQITPPRKDLRMDATLEILRRERIIHIHSYRQDEILMFARLAKDLNLEVGTFQHILEGYKVADALAEINAGASTFSDWWAYKFEVIDAIPYNGKILYDQGVVTSFNSDDVYSAELATRLNTEAAKAVKYGGLPEEEALKFVTLNPAIQLRIDDRVGSLEVGKDGDFVVWSDHPLSTFAYAEQTWIEGTLFFDKEAAQSQLEADTNERAQLVQKALKQRLKELKLLSKQKVSEDDPPDEIRPEDSPSWIYHDGHHQYSCAAEEEGAHL